MRMGGENMEKEMNTIMANTGTLGGDMAKVVQIYSCVMFAYAPGSSMQR